MSRSQHVVLYQSGFDRRGLDRPCVAVSGALVLYTNGLFHYHDGTTWIPKDGMTGPAWIRLFHDRPPRMKEDEVAVVIGLCDDKRALDDVWTKGRIIDALEQFVTERPGEIVWPAGQCIHPFRKGRMLARDNPINALARAVDDTITSTNVDVCPSPLNPVTQRRSSRRSIRA